MSSEHAIDFSVLSTSPCTVKGLPGFMIVGDLEAKIGGKPGTLQSTISNHLRRHASDQEMVYMTVVIFDAYADGVVQGTPLASLAESEKVDDAISSIVRLADRAVPQMNVTAAGVRSAKLLVAGVALPHKATLLRSLKSLTITRTAAVILALAALLQTIGCGSLSIDEKGSAKYVTLFRDVSAQGITFSNTTKADGTKEVKLKIDSSQTSVRDEALRDLSSTVRDLVPARGQ